MLKRLLLVGISSTVFCSLGSAQLNVIEVDFPQFSGMIWQYPIPNPTVVTSGEGGAGMNYIPVSYAFTRKSNLEYSPGFTTDITYLQTKIYVPATNQFIAITPRTIVSLSSVVSKAAGSDSGVNAGDDFAGATFMRAFNNAPYNTDEYKYGKYMFRVRVNVNNTGFVSIIESEFVLSPIGVRDWIAQGGGGTPGGGITPGDLGGQPINQTGFWHDIFLGLFVPQEENLDVLKDLLMDIATWGPLGLFQALRVKLEDHDANLYREFEFTVPGGQYAQGGTLTYDLTPYEDGLKLMRQLMAFGIWSIGVAMVWTKVIKKII